MNLNETSRQEYISRMNRVMNYVDRHIDKALNLDVLAGVANFSPYHFHRIFTFLTGETPGNYVQRMRVEKAARLLQNDKRKSISEIQPASDLPLKVAVQPFISLLFRRYGKRIPATGKSRFCEQRIAV